MGLGSGVPIPSVKEHWRPRLGAQQGRAPGGGAQELAEGFAFTPRGRRPAAAASAAASAPSAEAQWAKTFEIQQFNIYTINK